MTSLRKNAEFSKIPSSHNFCNRIVILDLNLRKHCRLKQMFKKNRKLLLPTEPMFRRCSKTFWLALYWNSEDEYLRRCQRRTEHHLLGFIQYLSWTRMLSTGKQSHTEKGNWMVSTTSLSYWGSAVAVLPSTASMASHESLNVHSTSSSSWMAQSFWKTTLFLFNYNESSFFRTAPVWYRFDVSTHCRIGKILSCLSRILFVVRSSIF